MYEISKEFITVGLLYIEDTDTDIATSSDADEVEIEDSYHGDYLYPGLNYDDCVDYTRTDGHLYTVKLVRAPENTLESLFLIGLEIRNLMLIFVCSWLIITLCSKIKSTFLSFFGR